MVRNENLEDALRKARPEIKLDDEFNSRVMKRIASLPSSRSSEEGRYHHQYRIAGASLVLAGIMLLFLNVTPIGNNVEVLAASVKSAAVKADGFHWELPKLDFSSIDIIEKRDK